MDVDIAADERAPGGIAIAEPNRKLIVGAHRSKIIYVDNKADPIPGTQFGRAGKAGVIAVNG